MITKRKNKYPNYKLTIVIFDYWDEVKDWFDQGPEPRAITKYNGLGGALVAVNSSSSI